MHSWKSFCQCVPWESNPRLWHYYLERKPLRSTVTWRWYKPLQTFIYRHLQLRWYLWHNFWIPSCLHFSTHFFIINCLKDSRIHPKTSILHIMWIPLFMQSTTYKVIFLCGVMLVYLYVFRVSVIINWLLSDLLLHTKASCHPYSPSLFVSDAAALLFHSGFCYCQDPLHLQLIKSRPCHTHSVGIH